MSPGEPPPSVEPAAGPPSEPRPELVDLDAAEAQLARPAPARRERVVAMDVLRGIAILGILPVNLPSFALPMALGDVTYAVSTAPSEAVVQGLLYALIDFKLISIFALLFGVGLELQTYGLPAGPPPPWTAARIQARWDVAPRMFRRLACLAVLGTIHAWFLWYGDILFTYGVVGIAAVCVLALPLRPRDLARAGLVALCVPVLLTLGAAALSTVGLVEPSAFGGDDAAPRTVAAALADPGVPADHILPPGREILAHRTCDLGPPLELRLNIWVQMCFLIVGFYGWRVGGLMLLGAAAVRGGLLRPGPEQRRMLGRLALLGIAGGLPVESFRAWVEVTGGVKLPASGLLEAAHQVASLAMALGLAALALLTPARWLERAPLRWFAAVGRFSLSVYLSETLLCLFVFDALGWFAYLDRGQLMSFAACAWVLLVLGANLWARGFVAGPVEWTWRTIADGPGAPPRPLRRRLSEESTRS